MGQPTPVGSFNVTQLGDKADKVGKDDNFRGLALYDNVLYYTKGSGSSNLTGQVNRDGTVSIWAVTSTVSGGGDQGADPNQLVEITDSLKATAAPSWEQFHTVVPALYDQVVRGVSFTPGTSGSSRPGGGIARGQTRCP